MNYIYICLLSVIANELKMRPFESRNRAKAVA